MDTLRHIINQLLEYSGPLKRWLPSSKKTDTGNILVLPGAIVTPSRIFPFNSLATVTSVKSARSGTLLLMALAGSAGVFSGISDLFSESLWSVAFLWSLALLIFISAVATGAWYFFLQPPPAGLVLEAASGSSETILSRDRQFIISLHEKILLTLSQKSKQSIVYNLDNSTNTVYGDGVIKGGAFKKLIENNYNQAGKGNGNGQQPKRNSRGRSNQRGKRK